MAIDVKEDLAALVEQVTADILPSLKRHHDKHDRAKREALNRILDAWIELQADDPGDVADRLGKRALELAHTAGREEYRLDLEEEASTAEAAGLPDEMQQGERS
jgi:hypothetical protein